LAAAKICLNNDEIYYNLAENTLNNTNNISFEDAGVSGKCAYKDVHDEFDKNKKIAILDDGFTALNIKKNINIILIDANVDIFIQNVIPAGILREPLSVLKYADIVVINKCSPELLKSSPSFKEDMETRIRKYNKRCPIFYSYYKPENLISGYTAIPCAGLKGKKAIAVSAIGNPDYFYENLINCGAEVDYKIEFQDHYEYKEKDINDIKKLLDKNEGCIVITTLKDYVKLKRFNKPDIFDKIYYLDFEIAVDKTFFEYIYDKIPL
jgi:tetraacyldisaccharide 4'-kinase